MSNNNYIERDDWEGLNEAIRKMYYKKEDTQAEEQQEELSEEAEQLDESDAITRKLYKEAKDHLKSLTKEVEQAYKNKDQDQLEALVEMLDGINQ